MGNKNKQQISAAIPGPAGPPGVTPSLMPVPATAPTLTWLAGAGSAAALTAIVVTLVRQDYNACHYRIQFTWTTTQSNAQVRLRLNNVAPNKLFAISLSLANATSNLTPDQSGFVYTATNLEPLFRNNAIGPLQGLLHFSIAR